MSWGSTNPASALGSRKATSSGSRGVDRAVGTVTLDVADSRIVTWEPGRIAAFEALGTDMARASETEAAGDAGQSPDRKQPGTGRAKEAVRMPEPKSANRDPGLRDGSVGRWVGRMNYDSTTLT